MDLAVGQRVWVMEPETVGTNKDYFTAEARQCTVIGKSEVYVIVRKGCREPREKFFVPLYRGVDFLLSLDGSLLHPIREIVEGYAAALNRIKKEEGD